MATKTTHPESKLQIQCVTWFKTQYPHLAPLFFAVPNGGARSKSEAAIMKAEGITAGVSDLILNIPASSFSQLAIEMKAQGGRQSPEQKRYQLYAQAAGVKYIICKSYEEFQAEVKTYLDTVSPLILINLKDIYKEEQRHEVERARREYKKLCNTKNQ